MPRKRSKGRLQALAEAATQRFIEVGYQRTKMADVARRLGVAPGTLYLYVESKSALFDLAVRHAGGRLDLADADLPLQAPDTGATLLQIRDKLRAETLGLSLFLLDLTAPVVDLPHELSRLIGEIYDVLARWRLLIKLMDRTAIDYPELGAIWFGEGRFASLQRLAAYLEDRAAKGLIPVMTDAPIVARVVLENCAFFAVHRHWDPSPQPMDDQAARDTVVTMMIRAIMGSSATG